MGRSALDLLEDSLTLLLAQPASTWLRYLVGEIPLLLIVLSFAQDMLSGYQADRCLLDSLLVTICFFWAAFWRSRFSGLLLASATDSQPVRAVSSVWRCSYLQIILQSGKLLIWPLAVVSILPLAWVSSFFRNITIDADREGCRVGDMIRRCAARASASNAAYWKGLPIVVLFGLILFINFLIAGVLLPELAKTFTGYETSWTRNAGNVLTFNLLAISTAATWFLLDPVLQAFAVVNRFYLEARSDGRDLMRVLHRTAAATAIVFLLAGSGRAAINKTISVEDLDRGVRGALAQPEFKWQRPAQQEHRSAVADRVLRDLRHLTRPLQSAFSRLGEWLRKLLKNNPSPISDDRQHARLPGNLRIVIYTAAALAILTVLAIFLRNRGKQSKSRADLSAPQVSPDLSREDLLATELPEEEWRRLAREYAETGEYRLAVRTFYLSNLAYLGSHRLISIARSKTNGTYERELHLRAAAELSQAFAAANLDFEKVWYGRYEADAEAVAQNERHSEKIRGLCSASA